MQFKETLLQSCRICRRCNSVEDLTSYVKCVENYCFSAWRSFSSFKFLIKWIVSVCFSSELMTKIIFHKMLSLTSLDLTIESAFFKLTCNVNQATRFTSCNQFCCYSSGDNIQCHFLCFLSLIIIAIQYKVYRWHSNCISFLCTVAFCKRKQL